MKYNIIGGFDLGVVSDDFKNHMLIAVTELRTKDENPYICRKGW